MSRTTTPLALLLLACSFGCAAPEDGDDFEFRVDEAEPDIFLYKVDPQPAPPGKKKPPPPPPGNDDLIWIIRDGISVEGVDGGLLLTLDAPLVYDTFGTPRCIIEGGEIDPVLLVQSAELPPDSDPLFTLVRNEVFSGADTEADPTFSFAKTYMFAGPVRGREYIYQSDTRLRRESMFRKLLITALAAGVCGAPEPE